MAENTELLRRVKEANLLSNPLGMAALIGASKVASAGAAKQESEKQADLALKTKISIDVQPDGTQVLNASSVPIGDPQAQIAAKEQAPLNAAMSKLSEARNLQEIMQQNESFGVAGGARNPMDPELADGITGFREGYRGSRELGAGRLKALFQAGMVKAGKYDSQKTASQVKALRAMRQAQINEKYVQPRLSAARAEERVAQADTRETRMIANQERQIDADAWKTFLNGSLAAYDSEEKLMAAAKKAGFKLDDGRAESLMRQWLDDRKAAEKAARIEEQAIEDQGMQRENSRRSERRLEIAEERLDRGGDGGTKRRRISADANPDAVLRALDKPDVYDEESATIAAENAVSKLGTTIDKRNITIEKNNAVITEYRETPAEERSPELIRRARAAKAENGTLVARNKTDFAKLNRIRSKASSGAPVAVYVPGQGFVRK
jgi:hypothetical protein